MKSADDTEKLGDAFMLPSYLCLDFQYLILLNQSYFTTPYVNLPYKLIYHINLSITILFLLFSKYY